VASSTESKTKTEYLLSIIDNLVSETDAHCQGSHSGRRLRGKSNQEIVKFAQLIWERRRNFRVV
jgi:hypothetical protein